MSQVLPSESLELLTQAPQSKTKLMTGRAFIEVRSRKEVKGRLKMPSTFVRSGLLLHTLKRQHLAASLAEKPLEMLDPAFWGAAYNCATICSKYAISSVHSVCLPANAGYREVFEDSRPCGVFLDVAR